MNYDLEEKVLYKGRTCIVKDYSHRFKQYTLEYAGAGQMRGYRVYDAEEKDMEPYYTHTTGKNQK